MAEPHDRVAAVTGAFSYSGRAVTRQLLDRGWSVRTLTNRRPDAAAPAVPAYPLQFEDRELLVHSLRGATTLFNTYWVRFPYRGLTFERALAHSRSLVDAARQAGVERIVHVSICNPSRDSPLPYYRAKAEVERSIAASGLSYAFLRPTVMFGRSGPITDVLVNNIAWFLRRFPVVAVPGSGRYRIQPVSVDDVADLAVEVGMREDDVVLDAAGPEVFAFRELVELIGETIGCPRPVVGLHPGVLHVALRGLTPALHDVVLTRDEISGLQAGLLASREQPRGRVVFSEWLRGAASTIGVRYASELGRHYSTARTR